VRRVTDLSPRIVTPEAVVLQFETAGLGSRSFALLLDLLIQGAVLFAVSFALVAAGSDTAGTIVLVVTSTLILFGYPIAFETLWRGRTPGKAAFGLRVLTREGAPVRFRHAAIRSFLQLVDLWLTSGGAAVMAILLTRDNQRLGDLAAGTLVLRERSGAGRTRSVQFPVPYGYESYAATLDTAGLTADEYGAVRSFLLRAPTLQPDVRGALAAQVAGPVAARMRHTPPSWVTPETFLLCVAAAHQRRAAALVPPTAQPVWTPAAEVWSPHEAAAAPPPPVARDAGGFVAPS
jgi:uncharacterized RDD family membrane protein YckC